MKNFPLSLMVIGLSGLLAGEASAQAIPDIAPALQVITDRQAERAQQQAAERALQQVEAVQQRVVEQATEQQAEAVQSQTLERVADHVERAQSQASERAQARVADQAQSRVEQVQGQVGRAQEQIQRVQERVAEQALERSAGVAGGLLPATDVPVVRTVVPATAPTTGPTTVAPAAGGVLAQAGNAGTPVTDRNGNQAFVEITLPDGARAIAFEWIMLVTAEQRARLEGEAAALMGFLSAAQPFGIGAGELLTFSVPPDLDANDAILDLVPAELRGQIDRNHLYAPRDDKRPRWLRALTGGDKSPAASAKKPAAAAEPLPLPLPLRAVCEEPLSIGMVDAQVDVRHAVFSDLDSAAARVVSQSFVEAELEQSAQHGTAVAALWLGRHDADSPDASLRPLLPGATLYSATVFHVGEQVQEGASALRVLAALDWLSQQDDLQVINMSLAGPPNRLLEQTINTLYARGTYVVAAMGNDGPHGPPRYPAAYERVVAVAATDRDGDIFRWSNQGEHVDYTALGVDLPTAAVDGQVLAAQSGTSLAAPVVSAFLACALQQGVDIEAASAVLDARVLDLGDPGHDPVYGKGLLHPW
jgi:minor extracellular protease Epr